ncbi:RNA polymerase sigma factor [Sorangium sp. So ce185]|uniref:RNA polymerase sigma factor n=1 Tax=Sorangium sp. So ce185 TaxID=3133287 RepID=UPI003F62C7CA
MPDVWPAATALALDERSAPADQLTELRACAAARRTLAELYAAHARGVHRFLCDLLGDSAAAADATQETFVRAYRRLHTLQAVERPAPWLFGIARHVSLEFRRARVRRRRVVDDAPLEPWEVRGEGGSALPSPEDELLGREAIGVVQGALAQLTEDRRAALLLRLDHGLCYEDIARLMEWSVPKTKVEIHRARQVLRAALAHYEGGQR